VAFARIDADTLKVRSIHSCEATACSPVLQKYEALGNERRKLAKSTKTTAKAALAQAASGVA
jgi:hypothetical protein